MKKYTLNEARQLAISCAKQYEKNLVNKKLLVIYKDRNLNQMEYIEVLFSAENYQHLTGLELVDRRGEVKKGQAREFYRKCIEKKLSNKEIKFKDDGTTNLKLPALPSISRVHSITKITGDFNSGKPFLYSDKLIGGVNFCLGLKKVGGIYVPVSALLEDIKKLVGNPSQVIAIFIKDRDEEVYKTIKHVAKGVNLENIQLPEGDGFKVSLEEYRGKQVVGKG